jgi:hypothetical protein
MNPKFILTALLALLILSTCKKDDEAECPCQYEEGFQQVKDWMYFKTGSYWIYEEENSGAIDTITVFEDWQGQDSEGNSAFYTRTISSHDGYYYLYEYHSSFTIHCLTTPACQCEKVKRTKARPGDFVGADRIFTFPPIPGNFNNLSTGGTSEVTEIFSEYQISSLSFDRTARFFIDNNSSEDFQPTTFFVSENMGLIRKELPSQEEVWNLIEFEVIQ